METLQHLALGFSTAVSLTNLLYCFIGVVLGTAVGVLPGLGPAATIAMLLPATFVLSPVAALIMIAGIFYGAQYGGSTTAILVNLPGETSSVVTAIDGHQMARQGRAGAALAIAALGSFFAGTLATLVIVVFAPALSSLALSFGPADYFALMVLGLVASIVVAHGSLFHASAMIIVGVLLGTIGSDINTGISRFTFGYPELLEGLSFVVLAMGLFGIADVIINLEQEGGRPVLTKNIGHLMPSRAELRQSAMPVLRGTMLGTVLGILPGGGATLASFGAYAVEKKLAKDPDRFGKGAIEGVAAPEAANNAGAQTSFIPMLTLGIPSNPIMAMMIGAMILHGIQPGPSMMSNQPALFWGLIVSMWIGNLFLVILNLPLIGIWVRLIRLPYRFLFPIILLFCVIGVFSLNNATFDVYVLALMGCVGYGVRKLNFEPAPLLLGFILGPMMEEYLRRALLISDGNPGVFLTRPISAAMLLGSAILLLTVVIPAVRSTRELAFQEDNI